MVIQVSGVTDGVLLFLALVVWIPWTMVVGTYVFSIWVARFKLHKEPERPPAETPLLPGVSIIKPLLGMDPQQADNLRTFFTMDYPQYELLVCVEDGSDPAVEYVTRIRQEYPQVDCSIFIGGEPGILNPMICNMAPAYKAAKYPIVWVSSSRVQASRIITKDLVTKLQRPNCALVTQMPFTADWEGFPAAVEKVYFGANMARNYLAVNHLGFSCIVGMSYVFKKSELDHLQGLSAFGRYMSEDFYIAKQLHERGFRHGVSNFPGLQNPATDSLRAYKERMVRWTRLRLFMCPFVAIVLEPLGEGLILGWYTSWSVYYLLGINPVIWFLGQWFIRFLLDWLLLSSVQGGRLPFYLHTLVAAWLVRELMYPWIFVEAAWNARTIHWGGRTFRQSNFGRDIEIVSDRKSIQGQNETWV